MNRYLLFYNPDISMSILVKIGCISMHKGVASQSDKLESCCVGF